MMKSSKSLLAIIALFSMGCTSVWKSSGQHIKQELPADEKASLLAEIKNMLELDQKYRSILSLGTMNPAVVKQNAELSETATLEEYMAFLKTVQKDLTQHQIDSLTKLQHELDYNNYIRLKTIITQHGYPSKERLGDASANVFIILLHPPIQLKPKAYFHDMQNLLLKEVLAKRMEAKEFAMFVDDIKAKILKEAQLYGTINPFDFKTMSMGLPIIESIKKTNRKRKAIGLAELKEGEYELSR